MEKNCKHMRLREWLIAQIESEKFLGLSWEDQEKSMFRIPWKHAAKQDYNQNEDAALFKAWAVYKGKYREGKDVADPSVWKTRLRCALNKSTDFREVPERSQLDISEPYKVYKIQPEGTRSTEIETHQTRQHFSSLQLSNFEFPEINVISQPDVSPHPMLSFGKVENGEQAKRQACSIQQQAASCPTDKAAPVSYDFRLQVRLFYQGHLVQDFSTSTPEGCRILHGLLPTENEHIYGPSAVEPVCFPSPTQTCASPTAAGAMTRLLPHLQRGVLLWMAHDGMFAKRFCQGRVYWDGPLAQWRDRPNKLERERTCKLLDMALLLRELDRFFREGGPRPSYKVDLCFGEEFPEADKSPGQKLITARVEPLFAKKLLASVQQQSSGVEVDLGLRELKSCVDGSLQ
ncbi:interferon regulatory factor 4-like isoform X3 [Paramormyrops kingsleyae]|uniref:interferon regulatory factor 4-like isoform X3 n=1 Tax=Paramormyrops kingsleyae TaxID=1676925 RepID=UPI003B971D8C